MELIISFLQLSIQKLFLDLNGLKSQEDFLQSSAHPCGEQNGGSENIFFLLCLHHFPPVHSCLVYMQYMSSCFDCIEI